MGANFSELVGPNKTTIGTLDKAIICITPLSIDIAHSNRDDKAVTKAGLEKLDFSSGIIACGISDLILLEISILFFSKKKNWCLFNY